MSEPNSLFAKIHITESQFQRFCSSKPKPVTLNDNLLEWWDSKEMYGKYELTQANINNYQEPTNQDIIDSWTKDRSYAAYSDYDAENEVWHLGVGLFTENYGEMVLALTFMQSVSGFKKENKEDYALIYPYFWNDDSISAYMRFENGEGFLDNTIQDKKDINPQVLKTLEKYAAQKYPR